MKPKLVRDRIPEIMEKQGKRPVVSVLNEKQFQKELRKKLIEEAKEAGEAEKEHLVEELADILELLHALSGGNISLVEKKRIEKKALRGGFEKKLFLRDIQ